MSIELSDGIRYAFDQLRGQDCAYCADGELEAGTYKGDEAMVCSDCDTPALREI